MSSTGTPALVKETQCSTRSALIIDGSYALIGARDLGGKIDYIKLRVTLEEHASTQFGDCWFFDQNPSVQKINPVLTAEYHMLKFAPPDGPQFQVSLFPMKKYSCHCRRCGCHFTQNVQKGVDNGIATKILSLAYENICDRFVLFAGDGDFYSSLSLVRNVLRKDIWVVGYRGTISGDLQQLASRVLWMDDLWSQVKRPRPRLSDNQWRSNAGPREQIRRNEGRRNEVLWVDHDEGKGFPMNPDICSLLDKDANSGRQVVIAPVVKDVSSHLTQRERFRGRHRAKDHGKYGCGRSRSRSRDRSHAKSPSNSLGAILNASREIVSSAAPVSAGGTLKKKRIETEGKQGTHVRNDNKRKWNDVNYNDLEQAKRGKRGDEQADMVPVFALSDISSDEECGTRPFSLSLPVPAASIAAAQNRDARVESGPWSAIIDLTTETESD